MIQLHVLNSNERFTTFWDNFLKYVLSNMTKASSIDDYLAEFNAKLVLVEGRTMIQFKDEQMAGLFLLKYS